MTVTLKKTSYMSINIHVYTPHPLHWVTRHDSRIDSLKGSPKWAPDSRPKKCEGRTITLPPTRGTPYHRSLNTDSLGDSKSSNTYIKEDRVISEPATKLQSVSKVALESTEYLSSYLLPEHCLISYPVRKQKEWQQGHPFMWYRCQRE